VGENRAAEALDHVGTAAEVLAQDFDGDAPLDQRVLAFVDDAHATLADAGFEPVAACDHAPERRVLPLTRSR